MHRRGGKGPGHPRRHLDLQYDPPQDPDAFVHRVGRTARMGRSGNALALLAPHEVQYVEFLKRRKVFLQETTGDRVLACSDAPSDQGVDTLAHALDTHLRSMAEHDRDVMDKGIKAFLSHLRGYGEHVCSFLFRVQDLDVGPLAAACALLRIPKVPEVRKLLGQGSKGEAVEVEGFTASAVDPSTVPVRVALVHNGCGLCCGLHMWWTSRYTRCVRCHCTTTVHTVQGQAAREAAPQADAQGECAGRRRPAETGAQG